MGLNIFLDTNWVRQEEPTSLIFRLLIRMRRMYLASIRLEYLECNLITRIWTFYHS